MNSNTTRVFAAGKKGARFAGMLGLVAAGAFSAASAMAQVRPFLPPPAPSATTVPANGDVNPYGVVFVPRTVRTDGLLTPGNVLVSNFNNAANLQGTGTSIVQITPKGETSLFFQNAQYPGLTASLGILTNGIVVVGNMPTIDGTSATVQPGSLLFIDRKGNLLGAIKDTNTINGPWGMAVADFGEGFAQIYVSNVLSGTITRFDVQYGAASNAIKVLHTYTVASGFAHRGDPAALELGPSGLAYDTRNDVLYVSSSADNVIYSVKGVGQAKSSQGSGTLVYQDNTHLHGPLDLIFLPNGHLLVANSDGTNVDPNQPSELVEFTAGGEFVTQYPVDPANGGAFGVGIQHVAPGTFRFAAVDDDANVLKIWTMTLQ